MSNSSLVTYTNLTKNHSGKRTHAIDTITIHHMAGNMSVEACGNLFADPARQASSNYAIGTDGRVALYVDEANRAWTSGNEANDQRAITIEVANDGGDPDWHVSDKALAKLIELCVDICKRNGIEKLNFTGDTNGNLTMHKWFQPTLCPGPYLESKFPYIAEEVNKRLAPQVLYRVQTGAFSKREYADALLARVKAAGFDTYMVQAEDGLYKIQVGAFRKQSNATAMANKLRAAGFSTYITTKSGTAVAPGTTAVKTIKEGSKVKVKQGAKTYTGGSLKHFVYENTYTVLELRGSRAVIGINGVTTAAMNVQDLTLA